MPDPQESEKPVSFEAAVAELDRLVVNMETGQLPLEQSLAAYERGAELLRYCHSALEAAEQQVKILEEGALKPFSTTAP